MRHSVTRYTLLLASLLFLACPARAQVVNMGSTNSPTINRNGQPVGGIKIAFCQPLATTAASVTSNVAVLTMATNPVTAGFAQGMTIMVAGFSGGDTYYNGGSIVNGTITSGYTILSVTTTTITYSLVHANAAAGTNGTALQLGNTTTSCAGKASVTSDPSLAVSIVQPLLSDGSGNWNAYAVPGTYYIQFYGTGITTVLKQFATTMGVYNQLVLTEVTAPAGVALQSIIYDDNVTHKATIKNNAGSAATIPGLETSQTWSGANTHSAQETFNGNFVIGAGSFLLNDVTAPQITSNQNNYAPTGLCTAPLLRLSSDASRNITGLGAFGACLVYLVNVGAQDIVLTNLDAASTAVNQFSMGANVTINPNESIIVWYDNTSTKWRALGRHN